MLNPDYIWLFCLLVGFGAFTQGFTGIGFGIIVLAGIAFTPWDFERATVVLNLLLLVLNSSIIYASWKECSINWRIVGYIVAGEIFGVPIGYWFILFFGNSPVFRMAFGVTLTLFAANELFRPRVKRELHIGFGFFAGVVGGFLAGAFTAAGPPLALFVYSRQRDPNQAKGTLQSVFISATIWRLVNIAMFGKGITMSVINVAAIALPFLFACAILGHMVSRRVSKSAFLKIVYSLIAFAGVMNIFKSLQ